MNHLVSFGVCINLKCKYKIFNGSNSLSSIQNPFFFFFFVIKNLSEEPNSNKKTCLEDMEKVKGVKGFLVGYIQAMPELGKSSRIM